MSQGGRGLLSDQIPSKWYNQDSNPGDLLLELMLLVRIVHYLFKQGGPHLAKQPLVV